MIGETVAECRLFVHSVWPKVGTVKKAGNVSQRDRQQKESSRVWISQVPKSRETDIFRHRCRGRSARVHDWEKWSGRVRVRIEVMKNMSGVEKNDQNRRQPKHNLIEENLLAAIGANSKIPSRLLTYDDGFFNVLPAGSQHICVTSEAIWREKDLPRHKRRSAAWAVRRSVAHSRADPRERNRSNRRAAPHKWYTGNRPDARPRFHQI